jgi:hypothetical protein
MFDNARTYNEKGDDIYRAAETMESTVNRSFEGLLDVDESEPRRKRRG